MRFPIISQQKNSNHNKKKQIHIIGKSYLDTLVLKAIYCILDDRSFT